jgi:multidrug resistance protein, MATE family
LLTYQRFRVHIKRTLALSIPVIISQIGHVAVSVADSVMVGRLGAEQLAGCSLGISMLSVFTVLGIGLAYGITPNVAQAFGAKKIANIRDYYSNVILKHADFAVLLLPFTGNTLCTGISDLDVH